MNLNILKYEVQKFITEHLNDEVTNIALGKSPFADVSSRELAEQIDGKKRIEKKLSKWFHTPGIYFPAKLSVEQCSSELTAEYKSKLSRGSSLIDLTGGFGVDVLYFAKYASEVIHCELNQELSKIAQYNAEKLGAKNIQFIIANSLTYLLETANTFDTIYVDPSRRVQSKKVFLLKDTEPDVVSNLPLLLNKASRIIIKTSPLFDIQSGLKELSHVSEIHVVSVKNDCKELIWVIDRNFSAEPEIVCTAIGNQLENSFRFKLSAEKQAEIAEYSAPLKHLYEPDVALLKAGCFKTITQAYGILKLHANTHLYTSNILKGNFIGKKFRVIRSLEYKDFSKANTIKKANIICRNFPHLPDEIKKKHKIADGGENYLIFTTVAPNRLFVITGLLV